MENEMETAILRKRVCRGLRLACGARLCSRAHANCQNGSPDDAGMVVP